MSGQRADTLGPHKAAISNFHALQRSVVNEPIGVRAPDAQKNCRINDTIQKRLKPLPCRRFRHVEIPLEVTETATIRCSA